MKTRNVVTIILIVVLAYLLLRNGIGTRRIEPVDYPQSLDRVEAVINGDKLTLRDLAFYVAYEESQVQEKAVVYDKEHPEKYWNMHLQNGFTRVLARNAAMQMALHDMLFYQMAQEEGITLTAEEQHQKEEAFADFWEDLSERDGQKKLGVSKEELEETVEKITYAQKYQAIYAELHNKEYKNYDFTANTYKKLLEKQDYKIYEKVWSGVSFGSVTLPY